MTNVDHFLCMGRSNSTSFMKNDFKFIVWNLLNVNLYESVFEGLTELLSTSIPFTWVLSGENSKIWVCFYYFLSLDY